MGAKKLGVILLLCASLILSGCSVDVSQPQDSIETSTNPTQSPEQPDASFQDAKSLDLSTIDVPSVDEYCAASEKAILRFELSKYKETLDWYRESEGSYHVVEERYLQSGGTPPWELSVEGPSLVAARRIVAADSRPLVQQLERINRGKFNEFVDLVFQKVLDECSLSAAYMERKELLSEGMLLVAATQRSKSAEVQEANPPKAEVAWKDWGPNLQWRWGDECELGFGTCKVVEVKSELGCSSLYVEANFLLERTVVTSAIDSIRNLAPRQTARLEMRTVDSADSIVLSEITCFG